MVEGMRSEVRNAYSRRSAEYSEHLGSMEAVHPSDRQLVTTWADQITGPAIDAGCGPGYWTGYLARLGFAFRVIDLVPEFIAHARASYSGIAFDVGAVDELPVQTGTVGGVLAWYSLIRCEPDEIRIPPRIRPASH